MGAVRKIELPIDDDLAATIDAAIAAGEYRDLNDLVGETLRVWKASLNEDTDRLGRLWDEGLASGEPIPGNFDSEDIQRRGMERLKALQAR